MRGALVWITVGAAIWVILAFITSLVYSRIASRLSKQQRNGKEVR